MLLAHRPCVPLSIGLGLLRPCFYYMILLKVIDDWTRGGHVAQAGPISLSLLSTQSCASLLRALAWHTNLLGVSLLL